MTDLLMREVEEELRQERYKKLWERYGIVAILGVVLVIGGVGGYRYYEHWQASKAAETGDAYLSAIEAANEDDFESARTALSTLAESAPGDYETLARLRLASVEAASGNREAALAAFDAVANDSSVDESLRGAAAVRAALQIIDTADYETVLGRLEVYTDAANAWRHSARDALAQSAYRNERWTDARFWLDIIAADPSTPPNLAGRVQLLSALVDSKLPRETDGGESSGTGQ